MRILRLQVGFPSSISAKCWQAYQNSASFVPKLATKVMQWLDPKPDDVILDIGCGGTYCTQTSLLNWASTNAM